MAGGTGTLHDPGQVPAVLASALGVREQRGVPAAEAVARVLSGLQLLLVPNNCEHVIGVAAELCAGLLSACDDVRILATSREPLAVAGEARHRLGPLALPDPDDMAGAARAGAAVLFADRACHVDAGFVLDGQTGPAVARLVAGLDGMPLAIELAAAWVGVLGVNQLADRLSDRFAAPSRAVQQAPGLWRTDLPEHDLSVPGRQAAQQRVDIGREAPLGQAQQRSGRAGSGVAPGRKRAEGALWPRR